VTGVVDVEGWEHVYSGKVRDLYRSPSIPGAVLMVASDRVSAFDHLLEPPIPGKGALLTQLSLWWFDRLPAPNHLVRPQQIPAEVEGRAMLVRELEMYPIECVVRGYLTGSGWKEYQRSRSVCGVPLPAGLADGDRLPEPIFTPAFKAPQGEHDENITLERMAQIVGADDARRLRDLSLAVFRAATEVADERGVILADTKFEFGWDAATERITLADEVLTSDSSRYWDAEAYAAGRRGVSFDKQIVRDWLAGHWSQQGEPPRLPDEIVERTAARYRELIARLTA
jgi:phosphoribosylaminoimidazole-succinocarboxamide synthase